MAAAKLNDGTSMPMIGLGTWMSDKDKVGVAIQHALKVGYKHIDCAQGYQNEDSIGESLNKCFKEGQVRREDVYIVSKLWCSFFAKEDVIETCKLALKNLQLDYLDLYLVHLPYRLDKSIGVSINGPDKEGLIGYTPELMKETWQEMEKLVELGFVKSIGVSNFTCKKLVELLEFAKIKPVCNQVELHPFLPQQRLLDFCKEKDIVCVGFSPLGASGRPDLFRDASQTTLLEHDAIVSVAKKHGCTPAQVLIAWGMQRGTPVLPKSTNLERIEQNIKSTEIKLDIDDVMKIDNIKQRTRYIDQKWAAPKGMSIEEFWDGEYLS